MNKFCAVFSGLCGLAVIGLLEVLVLFSGWPTEVLLVCSAGLFLLALIIRLTRHVADDWDQLHLDIHAISKLIGSTEGRS